MTIGAAMSRIESYRWFIGYPAGPRASKMSTSLRVLALISLAAQNVAWPQDPVPRLHVKHRESFHQSRIPLFRVNVVVLVFLHLVLNWNRPFSPVVRNFRENFLMKRRLIDQHCNFFDCVRGTSTRRKIIFLCYACRNLWLNDFNLRIIRN